MPSQSLPALPRPARLRSNSGKQQRLISTEYQAHGEGPEYLTNKFHSFNLLGMSLLSAFEYLLFRFLCLLILIRSKRLS